MRILMTTTVTLVACLAAGCSGSDSTTKGTAADLTAFCQTYVTAYVNYLVTCGRHDRAFVTSVLSTVCAPEAKEVAAGRVTFDTSKTAGCLAAANALTCSTLPWQVGASLEAACSGLATGTVAPGGTCYSSDDCVGGSCTSSSTTCPGACKAYVAVGGNCAGNVSGCIKGSYCDQDTCTVPGAQGATCGVIHHSLCADDLYCDGTCKARKTSGACANYNVCATGTVCANSVCTATVGAAGDCSASDDLCKDGFYCVAGKCSATPALATACDPANDHCIDGYCDSGTSKCTLRLADGSSCTASTQCNSFDCNSSGKCAASSKSCTAP